MTHVSERAGDDTLRRDIAELRAAIGLEERVSTTGNRAGTSPAVEQTDERSGVGEERTMAGVTREEVVGFEPQSRFAYELRSGLPLRNYHAEVTVSPSGDGSRLEWHSTFDRTLVGRLLRPGLARFVADAAARLVRAAEAP